MYLNVPHYQYFELEDWAVYSINTKFISTESSTVGVYRD